MKIIMLGAPGAGKGTQAKFISNEYRIPQISTGDIFRSNIKNQTELGRKAKSYIDQGLLVPDELTLDLVTDRLAKDDCVNGYILDGFPRTLKQADALTESLKKQGTAIDYAIDIEVADDVIVKRMSGRRVCPKCGASFHVEYNAPQKEGICDLCGAELIIRDDDKPETVKKRLEVYHESTQPLIDYYRKAGSLYSFDGTLPIEEVFGKICEVLGCRN